MIYKQCILTINGNNAKLDEDIYLFRLDKNIELYFTIVNNKYKFNKSDLNNIINLTNASYFQMRLYKNAEVKYTFAIQPTDNGKAILTITDDLIDEPIEVGDYDFQISLLDADKSSMISLPIVSKQIHVCEPLVTDASETGTAVLGLSTLESGEIVDAFDEEGNYIRKVHVNGELISAELFNKWEEALETNSSNIKTLDSQFKDIANKQKISVTDFGVKGDGSDETFLIENAIKNCSQKTLYFPTGVYGISKTLIIDNQVSLELDSNAKIIALEYMDVMIEWGKYNVYTEHCFITGGIVDGMGKAKTLLNLSWFRHFTLKDTVFLNSIEKGLVLRSHNEDIHSVEAIIDNIYFENKIVSSYNAIALIVNTTDSHISNVIVINYSTGVEVNGAGNRFYRVHPWVTHQSILNASKSFIINASNNTVTECLADSTAIGYEINKDCRILNSGYYCNRKYIPSKIQIFKYHTTNNPVLTVDNCLFDFEETVDNAEFINNECCNEKVVFTNCVYNNIKDKEQRQVSYYITKPHEANQPEYYNFAQIKIPKTNTTSTMSLYMSLIDKNYGTSSLSDSSNIEIRLQGYKNPSNVKDFSNFNVKIYCDNSKYKNKLYAKGKVDNENLIIDLFYKYNLTTWDYLVIKLDKITGNLKTYNNKLKLDWFGVQHVLGNQLFIYDNNNFVSSIESGYVTSFDFDYSKTVKELYIETDTHKASMFTDENGLVLGDWDKNPVLKIENSSKNVKVINSSWDGGHLLIGDYHIWVDENKKLRGKYGKPSNSLDGDIL